MKILAVEQSTALQSAALIEGDSLLAHEQWEVAGLRSQQLFVSLPQLLRAAGVDAAALDVFAVGLGPGSFSGVRAAVSAVRAMALPGRRPVVGVPSPEAIALSLGGERRDVGEVIVVGDARRRMLWIAAYTVCDGVPVERGEIRLVDFDALPACAGGRGRLVASPDWGRLEAVLAPLEATGCELVRRAVMPGAVDIGRLAARRLEAGGLIGVPLPIYLHPAVASAAKDVS